MASNTAIETAVIGQNAEHKVWGELNVSIRSSIFVTFAHLAGCLGAMDSGRHRESGVADEQAERILRHGPDLLLLRRKGVANK